MYISEYICFMSVKAFFVASNSRTNPLILLRGFTGLGKLKSRLSFDVICSEILSSASSNVIKDLISLTSLFYLLKNDLHLSLHTVAT